MLSNLPQDVVIPQVVQENLYIDINQHWKSFNMCYPSKALAENFLIGTEWMPNKCLLTCQKCSNDTC